MSKFAYYPGCSLHGCAQQYDCSTRLVSQRLGIELEEIPNWNCCGAVTASATDPFLEVVLNARNLTLAGQAGLDIVTPCTQCYAHLQGSHRALTHSPELSRRVAERLQHNLELTGAVRSLPEVLSNPQVRDKLQRIAHKSLSGLKIVVYYGCAWGRTTAASGTTSEPKLLLLEDLVAAMGGEALPWPYTTECCGGQQAIADNTITHLATTKLLGMAAACGADCIMTACPFCQLNLELGQLRLSKQDSARQNIPVLFFTQLMGLVLGYQAKQLGLPKQLIDPSSMLKNIGL
ncbi:MAG: CoB--CoM heterodisulfide reductase iron-sulfur subunit B family protein [Peptococcaceae bacterium]|nr:CoB--CoM heterodisulfide reductase iron-sulfur subunit B family protein [Peptococcaceae bacterium]